MDDRASDTSLIDAARAGDPRALETLVERHEARVYRFGLKMCRDTEDAKDVVQDTLLAMARGVREFRGASSVSTWLYAIARSYCLKKRRRPKAAPEPERSIDEEGVARGLADPARPADEALAGRQIEAALEAAIGRLEPSYREVLLLRDVEGLTAPEVAEVLGISVAAVKSRLHRARTAVRDDVAPLLGLPIAGPAPETCPDVATLFSQKLEDAIDPAVCAEMERHLESCPRCRGTCDSLRRTLAMCRTLPTAEVPEDVRNSVRTALRVFLDRPS